MGKKSSPDEVMAVIYADHLVQDKKEFRKLLKVAEKVAREESTLNIIEVKARFPNVHLGYVKIGKLLKEVSGVEVYAFQKFVEKPTLEKAKEFLASYKYLWNTGFYVWKIDTILKKFEQHLPETAKQLAIIEKAIGTAKEQETIKKHYQLCEKISIDYGVMEKVSPKEVRIIPGELGWSDIGTWESLFDELAESKSANLVRGKHMGIETEGTIIYGNPQKLIATVGVKDLVIVDTKDALIVCPKGRSQDIKKIVQQLEKQGETKIL
jgi:mannose-1-phosphate guanylyltransferase